jgi:hypothetical protein
MTRALLEQALEALESVAGKGKRCESAITAISAHLAQPQGEPVAMVVDPYDTPGLQWLCQHPPARGVRLYTYPAQPEGEPVCARCESLGRAVMMDQTAHDLHPDARAQAIARGSREDALIAALRTHDGDAPDGWQFGLGLVKFDDHGQFADFRWATQSDIDAAIERAAQAQAPAWHDKPTAPGLWVVGSRCLHINELDLPIYERSNCRWFGPVPADDGGKP